MFTQDYSRRSGGVVLEHQGACRLLCSPDGTIVCEPANLATQASSFAGSGSTSIMIGSVPTSPRGTRARNSSASGAAVVPASPRVGGGNSSRPSVWLGGRAARGLTAWVRDWPEPAKELAVVSGGIMLAAGGLTGGMAGLMTFMEAAAEQRPFSLRHGLQNSFLASCTLLGSVAVGAVLPPLYLVATMLRLSLRPTLALWALHAGSSWLRRRLLGLAGLLMSLETGDLRAQMDAVRRLVLRLAASPACRARFLQLQGVQVVVKLLTQMVTAAEAAGVVGGGEAGAEGVLGPLPAWLARLLAEMARDTACVDPMLSEGAVGLLVRAACVGEAAGALASGSASGATPTCPLTVGAGTALMPPPSPRAEGWCGKSTKGCGSAGGEAAAGNPALQLLVHSLKALHLLTQDHAVAQQMLSSEAGVARLLVGVVSSVTGGGLTRGAGAAGVTWVGTPRAAEELRGHSVALVQVLALEPSGKAALGVAGGVEVLASATALATPWSQAQAEAAAALHALVRGDPDNQVRLAATAPGGLTAAIGRTLTQATPAPDTRSHSPAAGPLAEGAGAGGDKRGWLAAAGASTGGERMVGGLLGAHTLRADLMALNNVVVRNTAPAVVPAASTAASAVVPQPAAPARQSVLQRLRLRGPRSSSSTANNPAAGPAPTAPATIGALKAAESPESAFDWDTVKDVDAGAELVDLVSAVTDSDSDIHLHSTARQAADAPAPASTPTTELVSAKASRSPSPTPLAAAPAAAAAAVQAVCAQVPAGSESEGEVVGAADLEGYSPTMAQAGSAKQGSKVKVNTRSSKANVPAAK